MKKHFCLTAFGSCMALLSFLSTQPGRASDIKDKRLNRISEQQLRLLIQHTSLESPEHETLISRARFSSLIGAAYEQYTLLWRAHPSSADANLWRGVVAEDLWQYTMLPRSEKTSAVKPTENLLQVANSCLATAVQLTPASATANLEYGFFQWQYGNNMTSGLRLMKKAEALAPSDPRVHGVLGLVYSNPTGHVYNLQNAAKELKRAITLDATYAFPHDLLSNVYRRMGNMGECQREHQTYQSLLPPPSS